MSGKKIPTPKGLDSALNLPQGPQFDEDAEPSISFSLKYWKQIENFALDTSDIKWFVSLLDCLKDTTDLQKSDLEERRGLRKRFRYHIIDWEATNIPIQRKDLYWLPDEIQGNDEEFPLHQLSITTGKGRFAGFWGSAGEETVFHIVLLDPEHNLQPSKRYNYRVDPCNYLENQYCDLHRRADNLTSQVQESCKNCKAKSIAENFKDHKQERTLLSFSPQDYDEIKNIIDSSSYSIYSIDEIVTCGLLYIYNGE